MITHYQYIHFEQQPSRGITSRWLCLNKSEELGEVAWYGPWRQYCFMPSSDELVFSPGCLSDILDFLHQLEKQRRERPTLPAEETHER